MKLVKGRPRCLPVILLVEIAKRKGIREQLIQAFCYFQANDLFQIQRKRVPYGSICLDLDAMLMKPRLSANSKMVVRRTLAH
jgi:hypothetical protein